MTPVDFLLCLGQFCRYEPWGILLFCWLCSRLCPMSHQQRQPLTHIMHSSCLLLCVCLCHQNQRPEASSSFPVLEDPQASCKLQASAYGSISALQSSVLCGAPGSITAPYPFCTVLVPALFILSSLFRSLHSFSEILYTNVSLGDQSGHPMNLFMAFLLMVF